MLYLKASSSVQVLNKYNGKPGKWLKTFAMNDQRNKNGWRLTWESIKKRIPDFIGFPGIEYRKCTKAGCDLDHTEGSTYESSLKAQTPHKITTIRDYATMKPS